MKVQPASPRSWKQALSLGALTLCLAPLALPMASASAAPKYRPPRRRAAQRTETTATRSSSKRIGSMRGCARDLAVPLTLLMPEKISNTSLKQPPLFIYLAKPKNLLVQFYENRPTGRRLMWRQSVKVESQGIIQLAYPASRPPLKSGSQYTWRVEVDCGSKDLNNTLVSSTESTIAYNRPSKWFQSRLDEAKTPQRRAELYAVAGYWTDTIIATAEAMATDTTADQDLLSLLRQINLNTIADREQAASAKQAKDMAQTTAQS